MFDRALRRVGARLIGNAAMSLFMLDRILAPQGLTYITIRQTSFDGWHHGVASCDRHYVNPQYDNVIVKLVL
jgi:hypothetical protein